ncbi:MAG: TolC family protein [Reichenbachiella sp.]|uniref:TolC family protein n=1 Tax=Reichenbachiella sp. TaxID=2184521 RepID=UPI003267BFAD
MKTNAIYRSLAIAMLAVVIDACAPQLVVKEAGTVIPDQFSGNIDTLNAANINWKDYFKDQHLVALIDTALFNNQELNIFLQEMEVSRNEVKARKGEILPAVDLRAGAGVEKSGHYTRNGVVEENHEIKEGKEFPEPLGDFMIGAQATWEVDVWRKLRNSKKAAYTRYLSSVEGRNLMRTNLIAEIANSYFELLALDNQLDIVKQNIEIQENALKIVRLQKLSGRVTELAVRRFEAEVFDTKSIQFEIQQEIIETENKINFLLGRYPQSIVRDSDGFVNIIPDSIQAGIPSQLLKNRPDIRQAELELMAARLDIDVARANFYPTVGISAGIGYQAFNPKYLLNTPTSLTYSLFGDIVAPLVNRNAIKAIYFNANAKQIQAVYNYEQTVLNAYIEVANQLSNINNLQNSYDLKLQRVQALNESIVISNNLFRSARADYMEVMLTQRDALESRFELIETKMEQMHAWINVYRALGGGWQ